jgi:formamidopyrimidine-DNA glycosylase
MPEAPEVSFITNYIRRYCKDKKLQSVTIIKGRYVNHGPPKHFEDFSEALPLKLLDVKKKGKVSFLYFEKNWCLISKLGLTGWWYVDSDSPVWMRSTPNLSFRFGNTTLHYTDTLSYGTLTFTNDPLLIQKELDKIAPEVETISLSNVLESASLKKYQNKLIEDVIIDQHAIMSGIGNYLKSEILYEANIIPWRTIESLSKTEWKRILLVSKKTIQRMEKAISHTDITAYENHMVVYRKPIDPMGKPVLKRISKTGRTTYYVLPA